MAEAPRAEAAHEGLAPARPPLWLGTAASVSRLHIVAIAALGTLTFGMAFTGTRPWLLAAICAIDWFVVNLINRVVDLDEDIANRIVGTGFVQRHRRALLVAGFGLLGATLVASHALVPAITPLRLGYHLLGLGYNWRLPGLQRRIKQLYFWKNTASAIGFLVTVFGYPIATAVSGQGAPLLGDVDGLTVALAIAFFFPFELSYEVLYDLRDAAGDAAAGVKSYPVVHGERGAVRIIDGLLIASVVIALAGYVAGALPWRIAIMAAAPLVQAVIYKRWLVAGITSAHCVGLTWLGAAMLAGYHLWNAAGLPVQGPPVPSTLELICLGVVAIWTFARVRAGATPAVLLARMAFVAVAATLAEESVMGLYAFYGYAPSWRLSFVRLPVLVALIWPVVVCSAWDVARALAGNDRAKVPWIGALLVLADAAFIEPLAVAAGLWQWSEPGIFAVPPIGILGWALLAALVLAMLERADRTNRTLPPAAQLAGAILVLHALLLGLWWGALRWLSAPLPNTAAVAAAWTVGIGLTVTALRLPPERRVPLATLAMRLPGALFFAGLLIARGTSDLALLAWAAAFVPPWLALMRRRGGAVPNPGSRSKSL